MEFSIVRQLKSICLRISANYSRILRWFPEFLNDFFFGVIDELYQKKMTVCKWQRKRRHKLPKTVISEPIMKTVTFIMSMLLGLAFPHLKIWLPRVLVVCQDYWIFFDSC